MLRHTQQRRMTGDVILQSSLQFLHMKAIDFPPSRPQKKLCLSCCPAIHEWLMKKTIGCIIEYCDLKSAYSLCITVRLQSYNHAWAILCEADCFSSLSAAPDSELWAGFIVRMSLHRHNICKCKTSFFVAIIFI